MHTVAANTYFSGVYWVLYVVWIVLVIAGGWKMFVKAGKPGWGVIIPFYNTYLLCKIAGRPGWWLILFFIPIVNIIIWIIVCLGHRRELRPRRRLRHPAVAASRRSCSWCSASAATSTSPSGPDRLTRVAAAATRRDTHDPAGPAGDRESLRRPGPYATSRVAHASSRAPMAGRSTRASADARAFPGVLAAGRHFRISD